MKLNKKTAICMIGLLLVATLPYFITAQFPNGLIVDSSGNVGIGTESPRERLEVAGKIRDRSGIVMPVGTILSWAGRVAEADGNNPAAIEVVPGWLLCNGAMLDATDENYTELLQVIRYYYGGSGNSFNLPDLRGMFLRGVDHGAGNDPDALDRESPNGNPGGAVGSSQLDGIGGHRHPFSGSTSSNGRHRHSLRSSRFYGMNGESSNTGWSAGDTSQSGSRSKDTDYESNHSHTFSGATNNQNGANNETRPKNVYVNYIIKY